MKLWKEYAIEPALFANYHLGNEILAGIGIEYGRIVGALPKKWARAVRDQGLGHSVLQRARLVEQLNQLKDAIVPRNYQYDGLRSWREQVFENHAQQPFDAILLGGAHQDRAAIDATIGLAGQPAWEKPRELEIPRNAAALAGVLGPLLRCARQAIIVDAYFDPSASLARSKWLRPLKALAANLPSDGRLERFEVHALDPRQGRNQWQPGTFVAHCRANLGAALPRGIVVNAMLWKERNGGLQFHERLIVTDAGGVAIDPGIDDGPQGETYTLRLLSKEVIPGYLAKFVQTTAPYDLVDHQQVIGS